MTATLRNGLLFAAAYAVLALPTLREGAMPPRLLAVSALLAVVLAALSAIDLATFRLPDALTLPLIAAGPVLAWALGWDDALWRLGAAAAGYVFLYAAAAAYRWARGREGLGLGDAKLLAAAGAWLGIEALPTVMLYATSTALTGVITAMLMGYRVGGASHVPFGPFLALGFWLVWLYGSLA